jgi:hypothetical protein
MESPIKTPLESRINGKNRENTANQSSRLKIPVESSPVSAPRAAPLADARATDYAGAHVEDSC